MSFWKTMSELIEGYTLQLTIRKEGDKMIVLLVPNLDVKKDEVQKEITPLIINGTPEKLDADFFAAIAHGLKQTTELQTNIKAFESSLKKAETKVDPKKTGSKTVAKTPEKKEPEKEKPDLFKKKDDKSKIVDKAIEEGEINVDKETGEIKEEPVKKQGNSIKPGKTAKKTEEKPKEEESPFKEEVKHVASNDDFGDEDW